MGGDLIDREPGRKVIGPAQVARNANATVEDGAFPAAQAGIPPNLGGPVVRQEDDDRVVRELGILQEP